MFNIIRRVLQKYYGVIKVLALIASAGGLAALIYYSPPSLINILVATLLLWIFAFVLSSFFLRPGLAILGSTGIAFIIFLRVVDLLTIVNVLLLVVFLVLLGIYFRKPKMEKKDSEEKVGHRKEVVFPKGWPFRVDKKKEEV